MEEVLAHTVQHQWVMVQLENQEEMVLLAVVEHLAAAVVAVYQLQVQMAQLQ
jgi:hypothetical protein